MDRAFLIRAQLLGSLAERVVRRLRRAADMLTPVPALRVQFPSKQRAVVERCELAKPGQDEVMVKAICSLVSPGTERARYLDLPNTPGQFPHAPGYCMAGRVLLAGPGADFRVGELVVAAAPHGSLGVASRDRVLRVSEDVLPERAVFAPLGAIALQGLRKARLQAGESVAIVGAGLIGQLALRLATIAGARPITIVAGSRGRFTPEVLRIADRAIALADAPAEVDAVGADAVLEVTGAPEAIGTAVRLVRPGGRIILLGSSRGSTQDPNLLAGIYEKEISLFGAHVEATPKSSSFPGLWPMREEWAAVMELIVDGRLSVDELISEQVAPGDIPGLYARLASPGDRSLGLILRWDKADWPAWPVEQEAAPVVAGSRASVAETDFPPLRIAMVGCGEIAVQSSQAIRATRTARVAAAMDLDPSLAAKIASAHGVLHTTSFDEVLANKDVEAVFLSVPHHLHAPMAIKAMEAGKHVIVEKPMATSVAACQEMIEVSRRTGRMLSVVFCNRYGPAVQEAKKLIEQGALGRLLGTSIAFGQDRDPSYWTVGLTGRSRTDWRGYKDKAGGGVLIMNLCHSLDYFRYLTGQEVRSIFARYATLTHPVEVEDTVSASYEYENGAIGTLCGSTGLTGGALDEERLWGTEGQIILRPVPRIYFRRPAAGYSPGRWHELGSLPPVCEREIFVSRFAEAVRSGRPPDVTGEDGLAVQRIIEAAYRSGQEMRPVELPAGAQA